MRSIALLAAVVAAGCVSRGPTPRAAAPAGPIRIVSLDPRFDALVSSDATVEIVASGHEWVEGPVWNRAEQFLLFSDIPRNAVYRWREGGVPEVAIQPSGYSGKVPFTGREPGANGLAYDAEGRLLLCEHGDRRIGRIDRAGAHTTLVDRYAGKRLNSPNDLVITSSGDIYFTDPPFGLPGTFTDPRRELPYCGVYRRSAKGTVTLLTKELSAPNGIALSPDGKTLYVANADAKHAVWMAYPVKADGTIGAGRVFFDGTDWTSVAKGVPDGMEVDAAGNLFAAGPGGVHVFAPEGKHLGSLMTDVATANVTFGGPDGQWLFITADTQVLRVRTRTKGLGY